MSLSLFSPSCATLCILSFQSRSAPAVLSVRRILCAEGDMWWTLTSTLLSCRGVNDLATKELWVSFFGGRLVKETHERHRMGGKYEVDHPSKKHAHFFLFGALCIWSQTHAYAGTKRTITHILPQGFLQHQRNTHRLLKAGLMETMPFYWQSDRGKQTVWGERDVLCGMRPLTFHFFYFRLYCYFSLHL